MVPYKFTDPFIDALRLSAELLELKKRCHNNYTLQWRGFGELLTGVRSLLEQTRLLDLISAEEEAREIDAIVM